MSTFKASYAGIGEMLNAPWMVADMHARAERVKVRAEATAPYDRNDPDGIHYRDAFEVESGKHGGVHHDRAYGRVTNTDQAALAVEYGNRNTPRHATLRRALEAGRD